jgi:Zn-finger protein
MTNFRKDKTKGTWKGGKQKQCRKCEYVHEYKTNEERYDRIAGKGIHVTETAGRKKTGVGLNRNVERDTRKDRREVFRKYEK